MKLLTHLVIGCCLLSGCDALSARMRAKDGVKAYRAGQLPEAAKLFAEAASLAPNNASIQLNLGFAELGRFQAAPTSVTGQQAAKTAITAFQRYLQIVPNEERARSYLIQTFIDAGQYQAALEYFRPEIERTPPSGEALATVGSIAAKTGHFAEARDFYKKRVAAEPNNVDARLSLAVLLWDHLHTHPTLVGEERQKMADEGISELKEAMRIKPDAPNAYTYTTLLLAQRAQGASLEQKRADLLKAQQFAQQAQQKSATTKTTSKTTAKAKPAAKAAGKSTKGKR